MDYNIYIHDKTGGQNKPTMPRQSGSANTMPKQIKEESSNGGEGNAAEGMSKSSFIKAAAATPVGKVAIAIYAAYKVAKKVVDTFEPFITRETGDYRFRTAYQNTNMLLSYFTNPVGALMNKFNYIQETRLYNEKQEQQRMLIGDAFINSTSRKV